MKIKFHKDFIKDMNKYALDLRLKINERVELFVVNQNHPSLRNHKLHGKYDGYRNIDITGDLRALYLVEGDIFHFRMLGSHSQLY